MPSAGARTRAFPKGFSQEAVEHRLEATRSVSAAVKSLRLSRHNPLLCGRNPDLEVGEPLTTTISQPASLALMLDAAKTGDTPIAMLTRRLAAGEEAAFREFHAEYFVRLFRYLIVCTRGDEEAARDALQETLIRLVRHVRCFDEKKAFWDWLTVLARSAAADGGRRRSRYGSLLARFALTGAPAPEPPPMNGTMHEALERSLEELAPEDRALLARKYEEGVGVRQIAAESGTTESAVESRLVRIRRHLRLLIFKQLEP